MNAQKKLKLVVSSLKDKELLKFFQHYINCFSSPFKKSMRQVSFNCFESVCEFRGSVINGYGKNSSQAFLNGIRNLVDVLLEQEMNQSVMSECLNKMREVFDSQKKLLATQKTFKAVDNAPVDSSPFVMSTNLKYEKKEQKEKSTKEEIFQHLNLENLKIANPKLTHMAKTHQKYMNSSGIENEEEQELKAALDKISELEKQISKATVQNKRLREQWTYAGQKGKENRPTEKVLQKNRSTYITNNNSSDTPSNKKHIYTQYSTINPCREIDTAKIRSTSVDPTQKYYTPLSQNSKQLSQKVKVPKLNLQILPNYHGKSNKSLNHSLLQTYEKAKK